MSHGAFCTVDENGYLVEVTERTHIEKKGERAAFTEDDGASWTELPMDAVVSMNMWGFSEGISSGNQAGFAAFLKEGLEHNPLKCEYFLPTVVSNLLKENRATVSVLTSKDKWYGVTYKDDKQVVVNAIQTMKDDGIYPEKVWCGETEALLNFQLKRNGNEGSTLRKRTYQRYLFGHIKKRRWNRRPCNLTAHE